MNRRSLRSMAFLGAAAFCGFFSHYGIIFGQAQGQASASSRSQSAPVVEVVAAQKSRISDSLSLTGNVTPWRAARLASPAEGPVDDIRVREGDHVQAGDALLVIGRKKGVAALVAAGREELEQARDNLQRTRRLTETEALPQEALDDARTAYESARAALVKAEEAARDHTVVAPWPGVVSHLLINEGEFVAPRVPLLEMYDPSTLVIRAAVPERHAVAVQAGMRADVRLDAYPGDVHPARIERVYPFLDNRLRTRTIELLPRKPVDLLPGMFARLAVHLKTVEDAVVVPVQALHATLEGEQWVFVVTEGKAVRRPVTTGIEEDERIQIETGLEAGEKVIVRGHEALADGTPVRLAGKEPEKERP